MSSGPRLSVCDVCHHVASETFEVVELTRPSKMQTATSDEDVQGTKETDNQYLYIRVRRGLLQSCHDENPSATPPSSSGPAHLYLIKGTINEIRRYAGNTVDWVIKVAHLICSPTGAGQVYTHTAGIPEYWYGRDRGADWRQVDPGDPLLPGIYEFESNVPIHLSQLSGRQSHSKTSSGSRSDSASFSQRITERDGRKCVASDALFPLVPTHLIPKRMGTEGAKAVVTKFVGAQAAIHVHKFHPMTGLLLVSPLSIRVNQYILGFYHNMVSK